MKGSFYRWQNSTGQNIYYPTFLYRPSLICMYKEFVNEVNKIILDINWKG